MLTAGAKSYTYNAAGRTVGINAPSGTTTLTYDYESRVTAAIGSIRRRSENGSTSWPYTWWAECD